MCNLHFHIREIEILHIITYEWKEINFVNSCKFFFSGSEDKKRRIYRVKTANAAMGLWWFWHHLLISQLEETVLFTTKKICKIQNLTKVCNGSPMLNLHIAELHSYIGKSVNLKTEELEHSQAEKNHGWVVAYGWLFARERHYPI